MISFKLIQEHLKFMEGTFREIVQCPSCGELHNVNILRTQNEKRIDPSEEICFLCGQHLEVIEHGFTQRSEE